MDKKEWVTVAEFSKLTGISDTTIYAAIREKSITFRESEVGIRRRKRFEIHVSEIDRSGVI